MGAACCCLRDECEDFANLDSSFRNCICLRCFLQSFVHAYTSLFHRGEHRVLPSTNQATASSLSSTSLLDNSLADMYRSPPRPLPYDVDPRSLRPRRDKGSSHLHEENEPLRTNDDDEECEYVSDKKKWIDLTCEEPSKEYSSRLSLKLSNANMAEGYAHIYTSSEDEDICPTCLEEYTTENPKIVTKCTHHYHLGCIYEWMERSDSCPVCGKVMAFDETT